jgi:hypothetical protein
MTKDSIFTPVSKYYRIAAIIIALIAVIVSSLCVFYYIPLRIKTIEMNKNASGLQNQKNVLQVKLNEMKTESITSFFEANFNAVEIYNIANKYFAYDISVTTKDPNSISNSRSKKIKKNNVKFTVDSPAFEILITETYDFSVIPLSILTKASPFLPENMASSEPISISGSSAIPTIETLKTSTKHIAKYNFKNIRIGEMFLVTINNPQISNKLALGTNIIEITRVQ